MREEYKEDIEDAADERDREYEGPEPEMDKEKDDRKEDEDMGFDRDSESVYREMESEFMLMVGEAETCTDRGCRYGCCAEVNMYDEETEFEMNEFFCIDREYEGMSMASVRKISRFIYTTLCANDITFRMGAGATYISAAAVSAMAVLISVY